MNRKITALTALITAILIGVCGLVMGMTADTNHSSNQTAAVGDGPDTTPEPVPWRP